MIRRLFAGLLLGLLGSAALATPQASFDIARLMSELARHPGGKARFVETRHLAVLDAPLVAHGEMTYTPPHRLEKRTLSPKAETLVLDHDLLTLERGKQRLSIKLSSQPQAIAFVDSIRGTLSGQREALERNYLLHLSGSRDQWVLSLAPRNPQIAEYVLRIDVGGHGGQVTDIDWLQTDGDRAHLRITPLE